MQRKQLTIIVLIVAGLVIAGGAFAYLQMRPDQPAEETQTDKKKRVAQPLNVIQVAERPYIRIVPLADGRNLELIVETVKKPAESMEYELEYQAGTLLQGAFDTIELSTLPATKQILLGSCSAGGACTYHQDVKGGTLLSRFNGGPEEYALKQDWRYIDNATKEEAISSKDAKFQLTSPELAQQRFMIVFNSPGYPEGLSGTPVSEPYSLETSGDLNGQGELIMRASEEGDFTIKGWDGSQWVEFETTSDGKEAKATVDLLPLYIVTK